MYEFYLLSFIFIGLCIAGTSFYKYYDEKDVMKRNMTYVYIGTASLLLVALSVGYPYLKTNTTEQLRVY